jgi:hypothetical protein
MGTIKALFKFSKVPDDYIAIDTTSNSGEWKDLSPFVLKVLVRSNGRCVIFENLWQYSKVYKCHIGNNDNPKPEWFIWRKQGWDKSYAVRYPMGKGVKPEYLYWQDGFRSEWLKLNYIESRKKVYIPYYSDYVQMTDSFKKLKELYNTGKNIALLDYDAYDHQALGMSFKDVVNCETRKCGHAFVLMALLTGEITNYGNTI